MPKHDLHDWRDENLPPPELGFFNCAGRYVTPRYSPQEQDRRARLRAIGLDPDTVIPRY